MDTDDLSKKTYKAIMLTSERFNHDLTLAFGLLSERCEDENEFIAESKILVEEMLELDEYGMDDLFYGNPPDKDEFHKVLHQLLDNIAALPTKKK